MVLMNMNTFLNFSTFSFSLPAQYLIDYLEAAFLKITK